MSRLERAIEILEALNDFFQEHDGQVVLYSDAQLLDGDITIKDAIADCLVQGDAILANKIVPRSQRRRLNTYMGRTSGWIGKRKIRYFDSQEEANAWLNSSEQ
jgi:hypothetical protein